MPKINPVSLPPLEPMKAEVGNGIAAFSQIESFLALLYAQFMHPAPRALSLLSFDAARHIEIKCRMLKVVGQQCLSGHHLSDFEKLMQRVKRKTEMRNKLAHWHVAHWHKNQPVSSVEEIRQMEPRLIPPYFSSGNLDFSPDQPIGMSELKDFSSGCRKLATDLSAFLTGRAFNAD
ncbi:hypothetical protein [Rhizobium sp. BK418]|uniref:hypothetical protein n=1 Tax=Rhizobium sp. BK418 TaxID=2512120 RepID=UPI00104BD743|nr:hypothetical protein [Rhizobium sp. BK418]TCS07032.1 hypothetical protein EV281_102645 [Rhizobium sp. BK418]